MRDMFWRIEERVRWFMFRVRVRPPSVEFEQPQPELPCVRVPVNYLLELEYRVAHPGSADVPAPPFTGRLYAHERYRK